MGKIPLGEILKVLTLSALLQITAKENFGFTLDKGQPYEGNLTNHVIRADQDGMALDLTRSKPEPFDTSTAYRAYIENILTLASNSFPNGPTKLLIHVHGGLNTDTATKKRLSSMVPAIMADGEYYPILLSWPSGPFDTYGETLVSVRRGRTVSPWLGWSTAPFILAQDLSLSVAKLPLNWFYQAFNAQQRAASAMAPNCMSDLNKVADAKTALYESDVEIEVGAFSYHFTERLTDIPLDALTFGPRVSVGTLGQSSIAEQAWENMKRRTLNVFEPAPLFSLPPRSVHKTAYAQYYRDVKERSLGAFFTVLNESVAKTNAKPIEITFVGHSMGTIVLNHLFTQQRNAFLSNGVLKNIVYMAAACSVNDGVQALTPLLLRYNASTKEGDSEPKLRFYNLTLNRTAEIAERNFHGVAPTGSLLEYIDQHLENPDSVLDRTLGSEINVLASLEAFRPVWKYCTFKSFDRAAGHIPQKHGDFNIADFWRKEFWSAGQQTNPVLLSNGKTKWVNSTSLTNTAQWRLENELKKSRSSGE